MSSLVDFTAINDEAVSVADQVAMADAHSDGRPVMRTDAISDFEEYAKRVIEAANLPSHHRMMALPKLAELIFWIRAGAARG